MIKLFTAPIRIILLLFPLFITVFVILWLQAADDNTAAGQLFNVLDKVVGSTVSLFSAVFTLKSFTKAGLRFGLMIVYVYFVDPGTCARYSETCNRFCRAE